MPCSVESTAVFSVDLHGARNLQQVSQKFGGFRAAIDPIKRLPFHPLAGLVPPNGSKHSVLELGALLAGKGGVYEANIHLFS